MRGELRGRGNWNRPRMTRMRRIDPDFFEWNPRAFAPSAKSAVYRVFCTIALLGLSLLFAGCNGALPASLVRAADDGELPVTRIPLGDVFGRPSAEISGLAQVDDRIVLLPQYPDRFGGYLFTLPVQEIAAALRTRPTPELTPGLLAFDDGGLAQTLPGFNGFEALAIAGDQVYMTIENRRGGGWVVRGALSADRGRIALDPASVQPLPAQAGLSNIGDEAVTVAPDGRVITLHEANGVNVNPAPLAHIFTAELLPLGALPLPPLEYRLTDATSADATGADAAGRFWSVNFFQRGDAVTLNPGADALAAQHGEGPTHSRNDAVERLVELAVTADGVVLTERPPLQLRLIGDLSPRNWEGVVRFQADEFDGFLLATDRFPTTILAFVAMPPDENR
jgi:hypothetical protein